MSCLDRCRSLHQAEREADKLADERRMLADRAENLLVVLGDMLRELRGSGLAIKLRQELVEAGNNLGELLSMAWMDDEQADLRPSAAEIAEAEWDAAERLAVRIFPEMATVVSDNTAPHVDTSIGHDEGHDQARLVPAGAVF